MLLCIVDAASVAEPIRQGAAVVFKNVIRQSWSRSVDSDEAPVDTCPDDRAAVKACVVELMLRSAEKLQRVLCEAIVHITRSDFPDNWPGLLPTLVDHLRNGTAAVKLGVLSLADVLFQRYRHEFECVGRRPVGGCTTLH